MRTGGLPLIALLDTTAASVPARAAKSEAE
jgi:hypothetical protein